MNNPTISKLSQGPRNPQHATYARNHRRIHKALCQQLSNRQLTIKTRDLYEGAGITSPTFYLHYRSSNEALLGYERSLKEKIYALIPEDAKRDTVFVILVQYISSNRQYFSAMHQRGSHYLLSHIIKHYRDNLVGNQISDRSFTAYMGVLVVIISCWLEFDNLDKASASKCIKRLRMVRVIKVD